MTSENRAAIHVIAWATLAVVVLVMLDGCFAYPHDALLHPELPEECRDNAPAAVELLLEERERYVELHTGTSANMRRGRILVRWGGERCADGELFGDVAGVEIGREGLSGRTLYSTIHLCRCDVKTIAHELGHATDIEHSNTCGDFMDTPDDGCVEEGVRQ